MMGFIIIASFIHIYNDFEKIYEWVWDLRILAHFQGSEMSPGLLQDFIDWYIKFLRLPRY